MTLGCSFIWCSCQELIVDQQIHIGSTTEAYVGVTKRGRDMLHETTPMLASWGFRLMLTSSYYHIRVFEAQIRHFLTKWFLLPMVPQEKQRPSPKALRKKSHHCFVEFSKYCTLWNIATHCIVYEKYPKWSPHRTVPEFPGRSDHCKRALFCDTDLSKYLGTILAMTDDWQYPQTKEIRPPT